MGTTTCKRRRNFSIPDHPHTRGDNSEDRTQLRFHDGPSPHAWGQPWRATKRCRWPRTIPTRVGTTVGRRAPCRPVPDHPHTRGDNALLFAQTNSLTGPSPHAWGQLRRCHNCGKLQRTIPTRVGTTYKHKGWKAIGADHPHTRGDNGGANGRTALKNGPSPHAWGQLTRRRWPRASRRTIPTRVGTTNDGIQPKDLLTDHPHTRGDNQTLPTESQPFTGPSPHAWGQPAGALPDGPI